MLFAEFIFLVFNKTAPVYEKLIHDSLNICGTMED